MRRLTRAKQRNLCFLISFVVPLAAAAQDQQYELGNDDSWKLVQEADPGSTAGRLALARRTLASGEYARARDMASGWIEENPGHELMPLAILTRGDALLGLRDEYKALFDYEAIARIYTGSDVFITALEREYEIGRDYARGKRRKLWGFRVVDASDEAEELLIRVQERLPGSNLAELAGMELGDFYFRQREMALATEAYDLFIENYPNSSQLTKARRRLIASQLATFKGPEFDARGLSDARQRLLEMKLIEPAAADQLGADALIAGIDERAAEKLLTTARWYWRIDDPISCELTIRRLVTNPRYERSVAARSALQLVPEVLASLPARLREAQADMYAEKRAVIGLDRALHSDAAATTEGGES